MSHIVKTSEGKVAFAVNTKGERLDQAQAEARCEKANKGAEELGTKTRYEVVEAA